MHDFLSWTVSSLRAHQRTAWSLCLTTVLAACATKVEPPKPPPPVAAIPVAPVVVEPPLPQPSLTSEAETPRAYRRDAASHLYARNLHRIYQGKMPPLLYAVGVLQVDINRMGEVTDIRWMRAPTQAPEVMAEIERSVRLAAPYPAPTHMGRVTYTDTWLWHKSGQFQLDTLTEGQN
jgi:periplasmic protein TonB